MFTTVHAFPIVLCVVYIHLADPGILKAEGGGGGGGADPLDLPLQPTCIFSKAYSTRRGHATSIVTTHSAKFYLLLKIATNVWVGPDGSRSVRISTPL